jgi:7-keto-8-aminopelargonate synthetase-like enzyme
MSARERAERLLLDIRARGLRRDIPTTRAGTSIDFSSNDYLGLSRSPALLTALRDIDVVGSGGSRLLSGAHPEHAKLEEELARFVRRERALLFTSGYMAALGAAHTSSHLVESSYSDADNHASIIDGLRLTRLERHVFPHRLPVRREERTGPSIIVSETLFGMSGASADIPALLDALGEDDLLLLDEAHALGICGEHGSGLASAYDDERIIVLGTLSKAFGCAGGFIAGPRAFIDAAINTARSFIFDTAMPPGIARAARAALQAIIEGDALRARLAENIARVRGEIEDLPRTRGCPPSPIVPLIIGEAQRTVEISAYLREANIHAPAIRPPTVPPGSSRIRMVVRADHTEDEITTLLRALRTAPL